MSNPQRQIPSKSAGAQNINPAQVTVAPIPPDDSNAAFIVPNKATSFFTDFFCNNRFEKDYHRYMMGVSSPDGFNGQSVAFVQLASPTLLWISEWTMLKYGSTSSADMPSAPDPNSKDKNWILLDEHYTPAAIVVGPDGVTPMYRLSGTYVYGNTNPSKATTADLFYARPPWLRDNFPRQMTDKMVERNIITSRDFGVFLPG